MKWIVEDEDVRIVYLEQDRSCYLYSRFMQRDTSISITNSDIVTFNLFSQVLVFPNPYPDRDKSDQQTVLETRLSFREPNQACLSRGRSNGWNTSSSVRRASQLKSPLSPEEAVEA